MRQRVTKPKSLRGTIAPPGDKSISHRALILNAIARGSAKVVGLSSGEDVLSTMGSLRALGVRIEPLDENGAFVVYGVDGGLKEPHEILDAGNSGTTMRLLSGLLAGQHFMSVLTGDSSLRSRPMGRVVQPLKEMGAQIIGRKGDTLPPLAIRGGSLKGIEYTMPVPSAQVKSAIMLAGLFAQGETVLHQPALSRDHTERMVKAMGCYVVEDGLTLLMRPAQLLSVDVRVPGDISAAAFWMVAALCHPDARVRLKGVGINPTRAGVLEVARAMGAKVAMEGEGSEGGEPVADLVVGSSELRGVEIGGDLIPKVIDEIPVLAVAACFAQGTTVIRDAQELRVKESDRVQTIVHELSRLGAHIEERPDGMVIHGTGRLVGGRCSSNGDHRLAMALGVAGLLADKEVVVDRAESARISYPDFWKHLRELSGDGE